MLAKCPPRLCRLDPGPQKTPNTHPKATPGTPQGAHVPRPKRNAKRDTLWPILQDQYQISKAKHVMLNMNHRCLRYKRPSKPYEFLGLGAVDGVNPYKFILFGDIHGPKAYENIGFRWAFISQTPVLNRKRTPRGQFYKTNDKY